jgi:hypothetical protein
MVIMQRFVDPSNRRAGMLRFGSRSQQANQSILSPASAQTDPVGVDELDQQHSLLVPMMPLSYQQICKLQTPLPAPSLAAQLIKHSLSLLLRKHHPE